MDRQHVGGQYWSADAGADAMITLRDGRALAWHEWGAPDGTPCLWLQGTPGSRLDRTPHPETWERHRLRVLMADRPGFGKSSRAPGARLRDIADDLAELLDHLQLDRTRLIGASGGGPHALALCAAHPDRLAATTVVVGLAPLTDDDLAAMIPVNTEGTRRARTSWNAVHELVASQRELMLPDPLAAFQEMMATAPPSDRETIADPGWQEVFRLGMIEALRQGAEGWADESMRLFGEWDLQPEDVPDHVVWWHGRSDVNAPLQAVERFTARMPSVDLRLWEGGHLEGYRHEDEILADLLAR
jgi:pimeloyl-ACP methyl ester carboxylesterase